MSTPLRRGSIAALLLLTILGGMPFSAFASEPATTREAAAPPPSAAQTPNASEGGEKARDRFPLFSFGDAVIRGSHPRIDAFFQIPKGLRVREGAYLDLYLDASPALFGEASTITVQLDDLPIASFTLREAVPEDGPIRIPLPDRLNAGAFHRIAVVGDLRMPDDACVDPDNEAFWVVIRAESALHLPMTPQFDAPDLSWYPSPFFLRGSTLPLDAVFVVPDGAGDAELSAVARLAMYFASQAGGAVPDYAVYFESELPTAPVEGDGKHAIWVGAPDAWTGPGRDVLQAMPEGAPTGDWIGVAKDARANGAYDMMLAATAGGLAVAAELLTNENLYGQLAGERFDIPADLPERLAAATPSADETATAADGSTARTVTFGQLSYGDIAIERVRQGTTRIAFTPPADAELDGDALLQLRFRHSASIHLPGSVATVSLNGQPVGSLRMTQETKDGALLEVPLKASVLQTRRTQEIDVAFQFVSSTAKPDAAEACGDSLLGNWAVIGSDSSITYRVRERSDRRLQSLPYPFAADGVWRPTAVVLPDDVDSHTLRETMTLLARIGSGTAFASGAQKALTFVRSSDAAAAADRHLIYVGPADGYPEALEPPADSAFRFRDGKAQWAADALPADRALLQFAAVAQLGPSPLRADRALLAVVVNAGEPLSILGEAVASPEQFGKWTGHSVLIDAQGIVYNFPEPAAPIAEAAADLFAEQPRLPLVAYFAALLAVAAALAFIAWKTRRGRRRD